MTLRVFDSKSGSLREFHPASSNVVNMYVCGPTVYSDAHVGHARSYVSFDVMRRYLEFRGYEVRLVINITDLDDVIDEKADRIGEKPEDLAGRYEKRFLEDLKTLNIRPSYSNPRVSENVPAMRRIIEELAEKGYTYEVGGNHYFRISLPGGYGQLTHESPEEIIADEARADNRENPFDFLIWKRAKNGRKSWDSKLGRGRPGWHVQCYAMMRETLGDRIDLHGGGEDLKFPHHESNILISTAHNGEDIIGYYIHNGFVTLGKEKMSKSLGRFVPLRELFDKYGGLAVRFCLLRSHYREDVDYDEECVADAKRDLERILGTLEDLSEVNRPGESREPWERQIAHFKEYFMESVDNDFDTSGAITALQELVDWTEAQIGDLRTSEAELALTFLSDADSILGLSGEN
jgi:cysteinyl-tRNA synthetase